MTDLIDDIAALTGTARIVALARLSALIGDAAFRPLVAPGGRLSRRAA